MELTKRLSAYYIPAFFLRFFLERQNIFQSGQTVLHVSANVGHIEAVAALLDRGCDTNILDYVSLQVFINIFSRDSDLTTIIIIRPCVYMSVIKTP